MIIDYNALFTAVVLPVAAAGGAWIKSVEKRLNQHEEVIKKVDQLVTILLEDRLDNEPNQTQKHRYYPSGSHHRDSSG